MSFPQVVKNTGEFMRSIPQDVLYGLRKFRLNPGFAAVILLTMSLGIGINTTIFSVFNGVVLRSLAYKDADRLVFIAAMSKDIKIKPMSLPEYYDWRDQSHAFEQLSAFRTASLDMTGGEQPEQVQSAMVTGNLFKTLGIDASWGRTLTEDDDRPSSVPAVVLSDALWKRRFGSDQSILGKNLQLNGQVFVVVGVMPPGFVFPPFGAFQTEAWVPLEMFAKDWKQSRVARPAIYSVGRLAKGASLQQAQSLLDKVCADLETQYPKTDAGNRSYMVPLRDHVIRDVKSMVWVLVGAAGLVLLIASANIANLLLGRAASREREICIRTAVGASRKRIIQQLLTESLVLSFSGAILGCGLSYVNINVLKNISPSNFPRVNDIRIDGAVLLFTLVVAFATGIFFGLVPALHASKINLDQMLKHRSAAGTGRKTVRNLFVVAEIGLVFALLVTSGLLLTSFRRVVGTSPGFDPKSVLTMQLNLPPYKFSDEPKLRVFVQQLIQGADTVRGVESAAIVAPLPLGGVGIHSELTVIEGQASRDSNQIPITDVTIITPDYFKVMGTRLISGRFFSEIDKEGAPEVGIIDDTLARRYWPGQDPVGKRLKMGGAPPQELPWVQIVGVVEHMSNYGVGGESRTELFRPFPQETFRNLSLVVRTSGDKRSLVTPLKQQVANLDATQPVYNIRTMDELVAASVAPRKLSTVLLAGFGFLALILGAVGVFSVMEYSVSERSHEIGIRMALGARPGMILKLVMWQGLGTVVVGIIVGLVAAAGAAPILAGVLFGVGVRDPAIYVASCAVLVCAAMLACFVPAYKATQVDPVETLK